MSKILLIEPPGGYIRLDRCMQRIESWGGVYRFPLNLSRIGSHLLSLGHNVHFIDLQADHAANLHDVLFNFRPDLCILSSGFPSMKFDAQTAEQIKNILPSSHVSTFGVVPTLLKEELFDENVWGFSIPFDSAVTGGEPALGYEYLLDGGFSGPSRLVNSTLQKVKDINTVNSRYLFKHELYRSPFTGEIATYIEGSYGCPHRCSFCVVPELYGGIFSKRTPSDIVAEFEFVIENNDVTQITLWDEGTTFQKKFMKELCDGLIELRKSGISKFRNFVWTTRSTTALLDEEVVEKFALSGLSGITLGLESFDEAVLESIDKNISLRSNRNAISLLDKYGIVSIGHIILGHINDSKETVEATIQGAIDSNLNFAQFYCCVPYPGTKLGKLAAEYDLIRVKDLTQYELCNPIMDTLNGLSYKDIGNYRRKALNMFWSDSRWMNLNQTISRGMRISKSRQATFVDWKSKSCKVDLISEQNSSVFSSI